MSKNELQIGMRICRFCIKSLLVNALSNCTYSQATACYYKHVSLFKNQLLYWFT